MQAGLPLRHSSDLSERPFKAQPAWPTQAGNPRIVIGLGAGPVSWLTGSSALQDPDWSKYSTGQPCLQPTDDISSHLFVTNTFTGNMKHPRLKPLPPNIMEDARNYTAPLMGLSLGSRVCWFSESVYHLALVLNT